MEGQLLAELSGALWTRDQLQNLVQPAPERRFLYRLVIGVDPAVGGSDETGIIVAGKERGGKIWILEDASANAAAHIWAEKSAALVINGRLRQLLQRLINVFL